MTLIAILGLLVLYLLVAGFSAWEVVDDLTTGNTSRTTWVMGAIALASIVLGCAHLLGLVHSLNP